MDSTPNDEIGIYRHSALLNCTRKLPEPTGSSKLDFRCAQPLAVARWQQDYICGRSIRHLTGGTVCLASTNVSVFHPYPVLSSSCLTPDWPALTKLRM